ncbi:GGDEF domain-containing protein [Actinoplanes sp. NPDC051859]|uniref:GGDEF domain-containing protein n=1 Tax=Actinoplanes sp. NPDC051859 TaxID=3363909 RepID=UPI00379684A7
MSVIQTLLLCTTAAVAGAIVDRFAAAATIRRLRHRNRILARAASFDLPTGVRNRAGCEAAYAAGRDQNREVIVIDLDRFKAVNDTYGHLVADRVLAALGARLRAVAMRHQGWAGRLGGDEFLLVLPHAVASIVEQVAADLLAPIIVHTDNDQPVCVRGSAGVTHASPGTPWEQAIGEADIALYHAKKHSGAVRFQPGMDYPATDLPVEGGEQRRRARDAHTGV